MQLIKTTTREKIVIPLDQSEAAVVDEFESSRRISAFDPQPRVSAVDESQLAQVESQENDDTRGMETEGNEEIKISPEII